MRRDGIEDEVRALRQIVAGLGRRTTTPVPRDVRAQIVACAGRATAAGLSRRAVARAVGVSIGSLRNWRQGPSPGALVPVVVTPSRAAVAPPTLTLEAPNGYRVEGLDVPTAAALLRALE